jgi:hypothetical protein
VIDSEGYAKNRHLATQDEDLHQGTPLDTEVEAVEAEPAVPLPESCSPMWSNRLVAKAPWIHEHLGRWVLFGNMHTLLSVADSHAEIKAAQEALPRGTRSEYLHLAMDNDDRKVYAYVPHDQPVVYYAQSESDGVIKIGTSKDVTERLLDLSVTDHRRGPWKLVAFEPGSYQLEKARHDRFDEYWLAPSRKGEGRELFRPGPELIDYMNWLLDDCIHRWPRPASVAGINRLVLDRRVEQPEYRMRLDVRVPQSLVDTLGDVARECDRPLEALVEEALRDYLRGDPTGPTVQALLAEAIERQERERAEQRERMEHARAVRRIEHELRLKEIAERRRKVVTEADVRGEPPPA